MRPPVSRVVVPVLAVALALVMALCSGGYFEADEISHYLYARALWHDWRNLVNIWGRMGATGVFALGVPLGLAGARCVAVAITALTAWGTCRLLAFFQPAGARGFFARHATAMVWLLLLAQPCLLLNCYTVMTEMLLACAWVWALNAACRRHIVLAGLLMGLGGLMRPEGWVAVAVWPAYLLLLYRRLPVAGLARGPRELGMKRWLASVALAGAPVAGWYLLGVLAWGNWQWIVTAWPWSPKSQYGRLALLFLGSSTLALAGWMWIPACSGAWSLWQERRTAPLAWRILVLPAAGFFVLHGTLGALGLFGSMALPRYFIAVAPLLTILAWRGLMAFEPRMPRMLPACAIVLSLVPLAGLMAVGYLPMQPLTDQRRLEVAVQAVEARGIPAERLIVGHPYVALRLGLDPDSPANVRVFHEAAMADAPAGTVLITDASVWPFERRPGPEQLQAWGYREDLPSAAQIDAVPAGFEPFMLQPPTPGRVRVWIKQ